MFTGGVVLVYAYSEYCENHSVTSHIDIYTIYTI